MTSSGLGDFAARGNELAAWLTKSPNCPDANRQGKDSEVGVVCFKVSPVSCTGRHHH